VDAYLNRHCPPVTLFILLRQQPLCSFPFPFSKHRTPSPHHTHRRYLQPSLSHLRKEESAGPNEQAGKHSGINPDGRRRERILMNFLKFRIFRIFSILDLTKSTQHTPGIDGGRCVCSTNIRNLIVASYGYDTG
jgi:hypothetical protein